MTQKWVVFDLVGWIGFCQEIKKGKSIPGIETVNITMVRQLTWLGVVMGKVAV